VISSMLLFSRPLPFVERALLIAHIGLMFLAIIVTGRRSGTLCLLVGGVCVWAFILPRKPALMVVIGLVTIVLMSAYVASYWNKEYGALAQPARAIRSQIDPSPRDEQSDLYREVERHNVLQTIRLNRAFGVGLGRPYLLFEPLPDLTGFWPLQHYTPHQNVLWLWLKFGVGGAAAILGLFSVACARALQTMRSSRLGDDRWALGAVLFTIILMYLAYATVDLAFASTRSVAPLMVAVALALSLRQESKASGDTSKFPSAPSPVGLATEADDAVVSRSRHRKGAPQGEQS
jgi:O-antigen ligase